MADRSKIEWVRNPDGSLGQTWNPVTGCTPASGSPRLGNTKGEWAFWWFLRYGLGNAIDLRRILSSAPWHVLFRIEWMAARTWAGVHCRRKAAGLLDGKLYEEYPNRSVVRQLERQDTE